MFRCESLSSLKEEVDELKKSLSEAKDAKEKAEVSIING